RYFGVFQAGAETDGFPGGVELVLQTLLESPSFLYLTELGAEPSAPSVDLTGDEIAALLAFDLTGAPPDAELRAAAARGELAVPELRMAKAARLLQQYDTRFQFRRFVEEWLGIDSLDRTAKDSAQFPDFAQQRSAMLAETRAFVDTVMIEQSGALASLLAGG